MFQKTILVGLFAIGFLFAGCAMMSPADGTLAVGSIYGEHVQPGDAVASPTGKKGEACAMSILGLIGMGDASIRAAARNAGIKKVATMDTKLSSILGLYAERCTVVSGE